MQMGNYSNLHAGIAVIYILVKLFHILYLQFYLLQFLFSLRCYSHVTTWYIIIFKYTGSCMWDKLMRRSQYSIQSHSSSHHSPSYHSHSSVHYRYNVHDHHNVHGYHFDVLEHLQTQLLKILQKGLPTTQPVPFSFQ